MHGTRGCDPAKHVARIALAAPRVLVLSAPPGYGKSEILAGLAAHVGPLVVCELPADAGVSDIARTVVDALVAGHGSRATRFAADRLAQRKQLASATARETLRREWAIDGGAELFVLHDPAGTLATPAGAELFTELAGNVPPSRRLAISMRIALPPALQHIIARDHPDTITAEDLALPLASIIELGRAQGLADETSGAVYDLTRGWPLASKLVVRLLRSGTGDVLDGAAAVPFDSLLAFAAHRTVAALGERTRDALIVAMLLRQATHLDLVRVLGDDCDDAVFARLVDLPFISSGAGGVSVHREVARLVRVRFEPFVKVLYERTLDVLTGDGAYVDAALIALDAGDAERSAAIIDAAPPYTAVSVPLGAYERVIERIDPNLITRYPNMWIATRPYRSFSVDRTTYIREAETVYYCLPPAASPDQRAAVLMHLASAYVNIGRASDADELLNVALGGFAAANCPARASILNFAASLRGIEGRFALARSLAEQAALISRDQFGESQALHYIECHEAVYRGQQDRLIVIIDELLRRRGREELPLYLAYAATNGAIFSWISGDDDAFHRYLSIAEDAVTPGLAAGFEPIFDAARGRPVKIDDDYTWPLVAANAHLYRIGTASDENEALQAARAAVRAADQRRDPFIQTLAHAALYVLDYSAREKEAHELATIAALIESPELHASLEALIAGERALGMLEPFVNHRIRRDRARSEPRIAVELLAGRVKRGGIPVRLTDKEFELLAFLATSHGVLSRERIGEALWEHLDPEEWRNNFKVTLHRIRAKLAIRDVVLVEEGRYRLAPTIDVDLRRAERVVREHTNVQADDDALEQLRAIFEAYQSGTAARYERFAWGQQLLARINDVICGAGITLANEALARGAHHEALRFASEVTRIDPLDERACETVVRILIDRGNVDGARREFRRYATALANELGAAPSEALAQLVRNPA